MIKHYLLRLVIPAAALFLSACTSTGTTQDPLRIGVYLYPGYAPLYLANEMDFFTAEGLNAEIVQMNDIPQGISALANKEIDVMPGTVDLTTVIAGNGLDVANFLVTDVGNGADGLLAKNDVSSVEGLKGKTVHLFVGSPSHFIFRYATEKAGLKSTDVAMVDMPPDQVGTAFVAGQIDYGMSWEPWLSRATQRSDGKILFSSKDYPGAITDTLIADKDLLTGRREDMVKFSRAWFKAVDYMKEHPAETNALIGKYFGLSGDEFAEQLKTVIFLNPEENLAKFASTEETGMQKLTETAIRFFREDGVLTAEIDAADMNDVSILQESLR